MSDISKELTGSMVVETNTLRELRVIKEIEEEIIHLAMSHGVQLYLDLEDLGDGKSRVSWRPTGQVIPPPSEES